ncbi:hypothetical protein MKX03_013709 [Papaver bracteatum]|nr:hypothetical protein MKX03_013709 [Papaver bracteatum]
MPVKGSLIFLEQIISTEFLYYTSYPKDLGPSKITSFTCPFTKHFDKVLEEATSEFRPHVKFMRVECPKYPGFCITRQRKYYPYIEIFHSPQQQIANQGKASDANTTKFAGKVLHLYCDVSTYGFREFFKRHEIQSSEPK